MTTQQQPQTSTDNALYDLVSVLYHSLKEAQACATYIQDAQQKGQQELVQFFQETQREANNRAEQAKQLLNRLQGSQTSGTTGQSSQYGTSNANVPGGASF